MAQWMLRKVAALRVLHVFFQLNTRSRICRGASVHWPAQMRLMRFSLGKCSGDALFPRETKPEVRGFRNDAF